MRSGQRVSEGNASRSLDLAVRPGGRWWGLGLGMETSMKQLCDRIREENVSPRGDRCGPFTSVSQGTRPGTRGLSLRTRA